MSGITRPMTMAGTVPVERTVTTANETGPDQPCEFAIVKAHPSNTGIVYVGFSSAMTAAQGTDNRTGGWPLSAGQDSPYLSVQNLNQIYLRASAAGQGAHIIYLLDK